MQWKPVIVVSVGLPGSGKSTYFSRLGVNALSSDHIRRLLSDDETNQRIHARVFATLRYLLQQRIELRRPVTYVDATNLSRRDRRPYIEMARSLACRVEALHFDVPFAICAARNAARQRVVPPHALQLMAARFIPPSLAEGFDGITTV